MPGLTLRILGTRGVPAAHGGFETFAERLALHLVDRGWRVVVYCQETGTGELTVDHWRGIERVRIPVGSEGSRGTIAFDWLATRHAAGRSDLCLTLGYNTAVFCALLRVKGVPNLINMDGIEWRRQKWGALAKAWFWLNDWAGCWLGNHLVADNPGIEDHLATRVRRDKLTMIPYGADRLVGLSAQPLQTWELQPATYWMLVARAEPENSILEVVRAFSRRPRGVHLLVLGRYEPERNAYHRAVLTSASNEVVFAGAVYEQSVVQALRLHAQGYVHGHQVGGTNPSLVEAMGAGNPVLAHDNRFNRWVAAESALYFDDEDSCADAMDRVIGRPQVLADMANGTLARFEAEFTWPRVLDAYERLLSAWLLTEPR